MVSRSPPTREVGIPVSGIGGIATWRDAVEFLLVGATTVQVGTSVMHYGYRIIDDLVDGLSTYLRGEGPRTPVRARGPVAADASTDWGQLDQSFRLLAQIDAGDAASTATCATPPATTAPTRRSASRARTGRRSSSVDDDYCVGCRLCEYVCPVDGCITFEELEGAAAIH